MKKRIALGVVAALAGGLLAAAPASAAAAIALNGGTPNAVAGPANYVNVDVTAGVAGGGYVTVTGSSITAVGGVAVAPTTSTILANNVLTTIKVATAAVGTNTVNEYDFAGAGQYSSTATATLTITVGTSVPGTVYASTKAYIGAGAGAAVADAAASALVFNGLAAAQVANVAFTQVDAAGTPLTSGMKSITAVISGVGSLGTVGAATGPFLNLGAVASGQAYIWSDGRAGVGTVTLYANGVAVATKTVTFYGDVATLAATQGMFNVGATVAATAGVAGVSEGTNAAQLTAKDANGVAVPLTAYAGAITATSSDSTVLTTNAADGVASLYSVGAINAGVTVAGTTGKSATITYSLTNVAGATISAAPVTYTIGGTTAASFTVAFDKASYAPGEKATVTVTGKDSSGNAVADGTALATGFTWSQSNPKASAALTAVKGAATVTVYMPVIAGPFSITVAAADGSSVTAAAAVTASAEATAQAAAITALQTAVASLQTTIASLVASMTVQIKVINAALAKIAKSLKVKI